MRGGRGRFVVSEAWRGMERTNEKLDLEQGLKKYCVVGEEGARGPECQHLMRVE